MCLLLSIIASFHCNLARAHQLMGPMKPDDDRTSVILAPEGKSGAPAAIIFFGAASADPNSYTDHFKAIQDKVNMPLWVSISCLKTVRSESIGGEIGAARSELLLKIGQGPKVAKFFYGGHGHTGRLIASWVNAESPADAEGAFGFGAYVDRSVKDPATNFPVPFLTVGAALDGSVARITRIAESYDKLKDAESRFAAVKYRFPVVVISGINLSSFMSGMPPEDIQKTDLRAEKAQSEAIEEISSIVSSFIIVTREGVAGAEAKEAVKCIDTYVDQITSVQVTPILDMF